MGYPRLRIGFVENVNQNTCKLYLTSLIIVSNQSILTKTEFIQNLIIKHEIINHIETSYVGNIVLHSYCTLRDRQFFLGGGGRGSGGRLRNTK